MELARKQLMKLGWKEGEGLGKNKQGIAKAIKPKYKFDTAGLGHDASSDLCHAWWEDAFNAAASKLHVPPNGQVRIVEAPKDEKPRTTKTRTSFDVLYEQCEGRSAHKGARHGILMTGKLKRLARQEEEERRKKGKKERKKNKEESLNT